MATLESNSPEARKKLETEAKTLVKDARRRFASDACAKDALDRLKELFTILRPFVPMELANYLAQQQLYHAENNRLFAQPEMDVAVWAHAHANGYAMRDDEQDDEPDSLTDSDFVTILPEALRPYATSISPLLPTSLAWGSTTHLQDKVSACLDSPIIHAWIYEDENLAVSEVVIVGHGIAKIRSEITAIALSSFFALEPKIENYALTGLIRLSATEINDMQHNKRNANPGILQRIALLFKGAEPAQPEITIPQSASEAMLLLRGALERYQRETGFVQVHVVPASDLNSFRHKMALYNRRASTENNVYMWSDDGINGALDVVTTLNYERFPRSTGHLKLEVSYGLADTELYRNLAERYHQALVEDILEDTRQREQFYTRLLEEHTKLRHWYQHLKEEEKKKVPDVWADHEIDWKTGVIITLVKPERVPASTYYTTGMNFKIEQDSKWLSMMKELGKRIDYVLKDESAPLERIVAARLFDAVLRDIAPSDDIVVLTLFRQWKRQVQPMLWLEWRHLLTREQITPKDVCTNHTAFNVVFNKPDSITLVPLTITDTKHSTIVLDRERKVQVVIDATDFAEQQMREPDSALAENYYNEAQQLAAASTSKELIRERIWTAIRTDPKGITQKIASEWLHVWDEHPDRFEEIRTNAEQKQYPTLAALRALKWMNEDCLHSAEAVLQKAHEMEQSVGQTNAALLIMQAQLTSLRQGYHLGSIWQESAQMGYLPEIPGIEPLLDTAKRLNPALVEHYLKRNILDPYEFPDPNSVALSQEEEAAIAVNRALEAAHLVKQLTLTLNKLDSVYESRRSAYYRIMPTIEQCYAVQYSISLVGLNELLTLLTGERTN